MAKGLTALRSLAGRLRFLTARRRLVEDVTAELEAHVELLTERYVRTGMSPEAANLAARRRIGSTQRVREEIYFMNTAGWLAAITHDLRQACRLLAKRPAFSLMAIATVALGVGATTAIFSVVYAVLVKPLPYVEPDRLYSAQVVVPERRDQIPSLPPTIQAFHAWRAADSVFAGMAALRPWECNLTGGAEPERVGGARVSANFFAFLGVQTPLGRGFAAEEEQVGRDRVVIVSDALWRRRYGADATLVGRTIAINGEPYEVIGVAPPSMLMPTGGQLHPLVAFAPRVDIWRPIAPTSRELAGESWDHGVLLRLGRGGSLETGRQQLETALMDEVRRRMPDLKSRLEVEFVPIREVYSGKIRFRLLMVLGASALLLLTSCASLANLLLARVATRASEFATRLALGGSRGRIVALTLAEAAVIALAGGSIGVAFAIYGSAALAAYGPEEVRLLTTNRVNLPMLAFAIAVSAATAIGCGVYPAWRASRADMAAALQEGGRGSLAARRAGVRRALVGVEMALATALLASAGLLLQSFVKVVQADRGYEIERVLTADLSLFGERYAGGESRAAFYHDLAARVGALPDVSAAGLISDLPATSSSAGASRTILHPTDLPGTEVMLNRPVASVRSVTSGYFAAAGTALRAGRFLDDDERRAVAVISESLQRRLWPGTAAASVIGHQFRQGGAAAPLVTVAGVVGDARPGAMDRDPLPVVYRPYRQWSSGPMTLVMRTARDPGRLAPAVRAAIRAADADLPLLSLRTMRQIVAASVSERQFQMLLTAVFAVLALLLGSVGLYAVVSYAVACGTRGIGLRMALGAVRGQVMRSVFIDGMKPVVLGLAAGLAGAIGAAMALRSVLFGVEPADPLTFSLVSIVLLLAAGVACYVPARRASRIDPVIALRAD